MNHGAIPETLRNYLNIIKEIDKGDKKSICRDLSNNESIYQYRDSWLLLSILLDSEYTIASAPPFYKTTKQHTETWTCTSKEAYLTLQVKFLVWLEYIVRRNQTSVDDSDHPISFLRKSNHNGFLGAIAHKFESWKADIFRGLFDPCFENRKIFQETASSLAQSSKIQDNDERKYLLALTGDEEALRNLLSEAFGCTELDSHHCMWASLFSRFVSFQCPKYIFLMDDVIDDFDQISFQKYCFHKDVLENLRTQKYITEIPEDQELLSFAFMVSYLFQNREMIRFLLPNFLEYLAQFGLFDAIYNCTYYIGNNLLSEKESCDLVTRVALSKKLDPHVSFINPLQDDDRKQQSLLENISNQIIFYHKDDDLLKALKWLELPHKETERGEEYRTRASFYLVYYYILRNQIDHASRAFDSVPKSSKQKIKEYEFWDHYLNRGISINEEEKKLDFIQESGKLLVLWAASLKENSATGYLLLNLNEQRRKTDELVQHLFAAIAQQFIDIQRQLVYKKTVQ